VKRPLIIGYITILILQVSYVAFVILGEKFHIHDFKPPVFIWGPFTVPGLYLALYLFNIDLFLDRKPLLYAQVFGCNLIVLLLAYTFVVILLRLLYGAFHKYYFSSVDKAE
jgi:hypothetical protein